ncbi:hypothetical protein U9M48_019719 [Paspalum notatum var. saurae]|uniref:Uncharacterized protein n=1 Tax=Paspalum notatum var. saurae TaxID=547442 RepID=A0AAQ3WRT1_PASNO
MATIQAMFQTQGLTFVMPEVRPPPVLPQWGMCPILTNLLVKQSGHHNDFINKLFASGGSGHNSNELDDM